MNGGQSYLQGVRFDGLSLEVTDAELLNRALGMEAKAMGKTLSDYKAETKDQAAIAIASGPLPKEVADNLTAAVTAFIDNPASFAFSCRQKSR